MQYRTLGKSGIRVSAISFGGGPISGLMIGDDQDAQANTVRAALDSGVNWFDTAATYGDGRSEESLGAALRSSASANDICIATKVRLTADDLDDIPGAAQASFAASLRHLGVDRVTLLQLHNSITTRRGDLPTSLTARDVLGTGGVVTAFESLKNHGLVEAFGFTGLGDTRSLDEVIASGAFTSAQVPLNLLTPFAGEDRSAGSVDVDYLRLAEQCAAHGVGVIAIRVFAGGALVGQPPAPHTHKTKFFTLDVFERDVQRAQALSGAVPADISMPEASVRYVLDIPGVATALIGFANPEQVGDAVRFAARGRLPDDVSSRLQVIGDKLDV